LKCYNLLINIFFVPESKPCYTVIMVIKIEIRLLQSKVSRFVCFVSSIVGLVCYALSSSLRLDLVEDLFVYWFQHFHLPFHLVCKGMGVLQLSLFGSSHSLLDFAAFFFFYFDIVFNFNSQKWIEKNLFTKIDKLCQLDKY